MSTPLFSLHSPLPITQELDKKITSSYDQLRGINLGMKYV